MTSDSSDYRTVKETAETWGVTKRYVNLCIENGRVPGAVRMGNQWLIPRGTTKPAGRGSASQSQSSLPFDLADVIAATTLPMPSRNPDAILDTVTEERLRLQYQAELAYLRGDFEQTKGCYERTAKDDAARLRAGSVAIAAAISTGDYPLYLEIEHFLHQVVQTNGNAEVSAFAELCLSNAYISACAIHMVPGWLKDGDFSALPQEAKPDATYKRAKYFQFTGRYEAMLAVAQTALALCATPSGIAFHDVYFRIVCAIACCALGRVDDTMRWLTDALKIALPLGFITPFAESVTAFGGLLEQCLERDFPEYDEAITSQWERTFIHWRDFHNRFTKGNVTLILSLRDYQIAQMAAHGVPYRQIAERFHISLGTLNNKMQEIYETLLVTEKPRRKELAKYIL